MTDVKAETSLRRFSGEFRWAGYMLGFGLGGFFDGIVLHQLLQWHHLLSGLEQARLDIRLLILWDGIFHALMYLIAIIGLCLLWRARNEFPAPGADRLMFANAVVGFGGWHVLDSIVSHWLLGIHRVRMDVDNPLFWDLLWFAMFGLIPLTIGWIMRRSGSKRGRWCAQIAVFARRGGTDRGAARFAAAVRSITGGGAFFTRHKRAGCVCCHCRGKRQDNCL